MSDSTPDAPPAPAAEAQPEFVPRPVARYEPEPPGPWYRAELATRFERLLLAASGLAGGAVLTVAVMLKPSVAGHGTHEGLGLPPCSFLYVTGFPCLSCGMTTSFAHTVRGEFPSALAAQPFGTFLALLTVVCVPLFLAGAISGRSVSRPVGRLPWNTLGPLLLVALFAAWGYKIMAMRGWLG